MIDIDKALELAMHCKVAYINNLQTADLYGLGGEVAPLQFWGVENDNSYALVVEYETYIVVAFRGTDDVKDWHNNLDARYDIYNRHLAHVGFIKALQKIEPAINELVKFKGKPLYITGHSLGGAMAELYASNFPNGRRSYTFGKPRVYYGNAPENMNMNRFTYGDDVVPHVPSWLGGYRHGGEHYHLCPDGSVKQNPSLIWQGKRWVKRTLTFKRGIEHLLIDHEIHKYIDFMKAYKKANKN